MSAAILEYVWRQGISGLFDLGDFHLNVNKGIGTNIFPFRFLCRPQIDVFYITGNGE